MYKYSYIKQLKFGFRNIPTTHQGNKIRGQHNLIYWASLQNNQQTKLRSSTFASMSMFMVTLKITSEYELIADTVIPYPQEFNKITMPKHRNRKSIQSTIVQPWPTIINRGSYRYVGIRNTGNMLQWLLKSVQENNISHKVINVNVLPIWNLPFILLGRLKPSFVL